MAPPKWPRETLKHPPETRTAFLTELARTGHVGKACKAAGIAVQTAYNWRKDPEFADAWEAAKHLRYDIGVADAWDAMHAMAEDTTHAKHFDAARFVIEKHDPAAKPRVEVTGGLEVNHPDVAAAIERFTARVLSLAPDRGAGVAHQLAAGQGESGPRVPVAELDSPSEPGGTIG